MKRYKFLLITMFVLGSMGTGLISCNKSKLESLYFNPETNQTANIEYLFTGILRDGTIRMRYFESYYEIFSYMTKWTQSTGCINDAASMMVIDNNRTNDNWGWYYGNVLAKYREVQMLYSKLPDDKKASYQVYMDMLAVINAYELQKITDLFGDVPYTEAGKLKTDAAFEAKFDTQKDIYYALLEELKTVAARLNAFTPVPNDVVHATLARQDVIHGGAIARWGKMANSIRLRMAMRLSEIDNAKAVSVITEIIGGNLPLITATADDAIFKGVLPDGDMTGLFCRGARETGLTNGFLGTYMLSQLNPVADPRLHLLFDGRYSDRTYVPFPSSPDAQRNIASTSQNRSNYAYLDSMLFMQNKTFPGVIITSSDVNFIKAEAFLRSFTTGDARAEFNAGVRASIAFYNANRALAGTTGYTAPTTAQIDTTVNRLLAQWDAATTNGKLSLLYNQKWVHTNLFEPYETWAELRRVDQPVLPNETDNGTILQRPKRFVYPQVEMLYNSNYQAVKAQDNLQTKVWWDKN
jgi:hypothetical protein